MSSKSPTPDDAPVVDVIRESFDQQSIPMRPSNQQTIGTLMANRTAVETRVPITFRQPSKWYRMLGSAPAITVGILIAIVIWRIDISHSPTATNDEKSAPNISKDLPDTSLGQQAPKQTMPVESPKKETQVKEAAKPNPSNNGENKVRHTLKQLDAKVVAKELGVVLEPHNTTVTADQRINSVTVVGSDDGIRVAAQYIADLRRIGANAETTARFKPSILSAIRYCNQCIENRKTNPQKMASYFGSLTSSNTPEKQASLEQGLASLGVPKSVRRVQPGVSESRKWLTTSRSTEYTYTMDYTRLLSDVQAFFDAALGDEITQAMLDGIRDDKQGPKIDVRKIVTTFENECILVLQTSDAAKHGESVMLAIPLNDAAFVSNAVDRAMAIEPDASTESVNGIGVHLIRREGNTVHCICIVKDHFIIGEPTMVIAAVNRW